MIRALYTAASGMMVEARKLDLTAGNLYNAQSPGFKGNRVLRAAQPPTAPNLPTDVQTLFVGQFVDPSAGPVRPTGKDLDLALEGNGFFALQTPGGVAYTRDGRFRRGADGVVQDATGNPLLGEDGPIRFPEKARSDALVEVDRDGSFRVDGKTVGRLLLQDFPRFRGLQAAGASLFYPTGATAPTPASGKVIQKAVEQANVQSVAEMSRMIESLRAFESYQKVVQTVMDELTGEAVRRIGRVA
jgi:flagellar basal body rod protein FlgG